jgi:5-methylcytosine-specific restriction endonuclease McrA
MSYRYRHGMNWIRQEKRLALYMRDNFACLYCGTGVEEEVIMTLDHVQHWGGNDPSNLVTACMECNVSKSWRSLKTFLRELTGDDARKSEKIIARVQHSLKVDVKQFLPEAKEIIRQRKTKVPF